MKAFKVFNENWQCNNFQYKIGDTFKFKGILRICAAGFHFCPKLTNCFNYYKFDPKNKIAEVEILGDIEWDTIKEKGCTNKIKLIREINWHECLDMINTGSCNTGRSNSGHGNSGNGNSGNRNSGHWNSGNRNSGNRNSGDWNSGHWNSGNRNSGHGNSGHGNSGDWNSGHGNSGNRNSGHGNSGDWNSGHWNSGNRNSGNRNSGDWNSGHGNSGFCNTQSPKKIYVFNQLINKARWDNAVIPDFFYSEFIPMNWKAAYRNATYQDRQLLLKLPKFNKKTWFELTNIDLDNAESWLFDDADAIQTAIKRIFGEN